MLSELRMLNNVSQHLIMLIFKGMIWPLSNILFLFEIVHKGRYCISHCINLHYNGFGKCDGFRRRKHQKGYAEETFLCSSRPSMVSRIDRSELVIVIRLSFEYAENYNSV